jgi:hypothetical protein
MGPFFFAEVTVAATCYLDMLENFTVAQVENLQPTVVFKQERAPLHDESS